MNMSNWTKWTKWTKWAKCLGVGLAQLLRPLLVAQEKLVGQSMPYRF